VNKKLVDVYCVLDYYEREQDGQSYWVMDGLLYGETMLSDVLAEHKGKRVRVIIEDTEGGEGE